MIVPMKKATVIVEAGDAKDTVAKLGRMGVLHTENHQAPQGKDIASLKDDIAVISKVIDILSIPEFTKGLPIRSARNIHDWRFAGRHIADLYARLDQLGEFSHRMKSDIMEWESWGDFNPGSVAELEKKGIFVRLCMIPLEEMEKLPQEAIVKKLFVTGKLTGCAVISRSRMDLPFKELVLPKMSLAKMQDRLSEDLEVMEAIRISIRRYAAYRVRFVRIREAFEKELEMHEAEKGMGRADDISYITGYVPVDAVAKLESAARSERWGISITDPSEEDNVPTLIRNPEWVSIIQPIFRIIEVVPGYRELDISMWFLLFFSVFFGMLIGDAGYGAIFIIITFIAQRKFGNKVASKAPFVLLYVLSSFAVLWGVLSGSFFGQEWLSSFKPPIPALRNDKSVQTICFFIGALQLSIGLTWRAILKWPALVFLCDVGWAIILWGGFFLAKYLILGDPLPAFAKWLFIVGCFLVLFFTNPNRNPLKAIGSGAGNLALNFMNGFTDVVSYIRLFAVGLAGMAVADSFNKMASEVGFNSILSGFLAAFILFIGHGLNVLLGPLSIIVHGVRLNVLEFCSHVDIKWSGFSYRPLKAKSAETIAP